MDKAMNVRPLRPHRRQFGRLRRFAGCEDGSATVMALFLLMTMLLVGGIAIDLMRYEANRSRLQSVLDRAVLAAADLGQTRPCEEVVNDYFEKNDMADKVTSITCTETLNGRTVAATAELDLDPFFMIGVDRLIAPAGGAATESVENIEISLVLDISGSMRFNNRMNFLRPAAREFVADVMRDAEPDTVSINLVPYAGQTNPGPEMFDYLNGQRYPALLLDDRGTANLDDDIWFPNESSCLEISNPQFSNMNLPEPNAAQVPHFMNWAIAADVMDWGWCPHDRSSIRYMQNSVSDLDTFINTMRMHDGTGTHYAMKWGLALLNPANQPAIQYLADRGVVNPVFANRPAAFDDDETLKFIVLMTDGQITEQTRPRDPMHVQNPTRELQRRPSNHRTNITTASTNVNSFYAQCNLAKANGVIVFTIAFGAPASAETQMANCASSPSHFYRATGADISDVFNSIANQINTLRLIQ